jgi:hypothetical protein
MAAKKNTRTPQGGTFKKVKGKNGKTKYVGDTRTLTKGQIGAMFANGYKPKHPAKRRRSK